MRPASVRQTRPIPHGIVDIGGLVDLCARRRELVQNLGDLTSRIIAVGRLRTVGERHCRPPREGVVGKGGGAGGTGESLETIEDVKGVGVRRGSIGECQAIAVLVIRIRERDAGLMA